MATASEPLPRESGATDLVAVVLIVVGVTQLATAVIAFLAPGAFYDLVAGYPPENHHFIRDLGSWQLGLGAAALVAARRPAWQVPMLGILALQFGLHTISHVIDVADSDPSWHGPFGLVTQALGTVVLAGLFVRERGR
jgi:hypothetical protein